MDPKEKVALISGGARIGRVVAEALAGRGCSVALTWRGSQQSAEETVTAVRAKGVRGLAVPADLERPGAAAAAVQAVRNSLGRLDILVCMASCYERTDFPRLLRDLEVLLDGRNG